MLDNKHFYTKDKKLYKSAVCLEKTQSVAAMFLLALFIRLQTFHLQIKRSNKL